MFWYLLQKIRYQFLPSAIECNPVRSSTLVTSLDAYAWRFRIRARAQCCTNAWVQALDAQMQIRSIAAIDDQAHIRSIVEAQWSSAEPQQLSTTFFLLCCFLFRYFYLFILCLFLISYFICVLYFILFCLVRLFSLSYF